MENIKKLIEIIEREELLPASFPILVQAKKEIAAQCSPAIKDVEQEIDFKHVIFDRINYFSNIHHTFEANELHNALNIILRLVPPSNFESAGA